jgi:hypothetical protein
VTSEYEEEEYVSEESKELWESLLEDDEISSEEEAFFQGYLKAGKSRVVEFEIKD